MTDDIDPATLPDDTRDGEADPGGADVIEGADQPEDGDDAADQPINEDKEDDE